jgi:hypothetical protein
MRTLGWSFIITVVTVLGGGVAGADEAPIAGTVKAVDLMARTLTVESSVRGKLRVVVIDVKPTSKIVRFVRSTETSKPGFNEQPAALEDIKAGWTVNVTTRHQGNREVADVVRVVHEK